MSFQMIHMEIAYRLFDDLPEAENRAEFILGSVALDSVHMNPDYEVGMKVKSHLFEGCGQWGDTQDYERWKHNIMKFYREIGHVGQTRKERDFMLGLCVHCLTDYWNDIKIWKKLQKEYIPPMTLKEFGDGYYPEARGIDLWLYQNSENTKAIREMLSRARAFEGGGLVNKEDIERQREYLLEVQYASNADTGRENLLDYRFLSVNLMEDFMVFTVDAIKETFLSMTSTG